MQNISYIITDFKQNYELTESTTNEKIILNRYGVWLVRGNVMEEVIDTSNDLEYLKEKYNTDEVIQLK